MKSVFRVCYVSDIHYKLLCGMLIQDVDLTVMLGGGFHGPSWSREHAISKAQRGAEEVCSFMHCSAMGQQRKSRCGDQRGIEKDWSTIAETWAPDLTDKAATLCDHMHKYSGALCHINATNVSYLNLDGFNKIAR